MKNRYLEKIAGFPRIGLGKKVAPALGTIPGGKANRIKGAISSTAAGGVAGSVFGRSPAG